MPASAYQFSWGVMLIVAAFLVGVLAAVTSAGWGYTVAVALLVVGIILCLSGARADRRTM